MYSAVVRQAAQAWLACMGIQVPAGVLNTGIEGAGGDKASTVSTSTPIGSSCYGALITYDDHLNCILSLLMSQQNPRHPLRQREQQRESRARPPKHFISQTALGCT